MISTMMFALLLTQSTNPYSEAECWTYEEIGTAPENVALQLEIEPAFASSEGVVLPPDTARYAVWRLQCLKHWPEVAQAKLDEQAVVYEFQLERERKLRDLLVKEAAPQPAGGVPWPWVLGGVGLALATGLVVGLVAGR